MCIIEWRLYLLIFGLYKAEKSFKYFGKNAKNATGSLESWSETKRSYLSIYEPKFCT